MRPSVGEVSVALYGAWRLMRFDPDGIKYFLTTRDDFWKSFYAAVFCLPGLAIVVLSQGDESSSGLFAVLRFSLMFFLGLLVMAVLVQAICDVIDRQQHFIRCIVAINWSSVLRVYLVVPVFLLGSIAPGSTIFLFALFCVSVFVMIYEGFIYHRSLEVTGFAAAGFVVLNFTVSLFLRSLIVAS